MKKVLLFVTLSCLLCNSATTFAAIKCWTNKEGVRECGNTIPPEYSQQGSETINERGITVETQERALTKEELEAKLKREKEERRRAAEEAEKRKVQDAADKVLLYTFLSEEEIITARDRKLGVIDGNIEITNITISKLQEELDMQRKKAASYERKGKVVPQPTLDEIASLERQIKSKEDFIKAREVDKSVIREKYDKDLKRFRELKAQQ